MGTGLACGPKLAVHETLPHKLLGSGPERGRGGQGEGDDAPRTCQIGPPDLPNQSSRDPCRCVCVFGACSMYVLGVCQSILPSHALAMLKPSTQVKVDASHPKST